jgi:hypothetical protein
VAGDIFARLNRRIFDFVQLPANRRLRPGTGSYSTLFRGTLFGLEDAAAVAQRLKRTKVDVLWLGANPCVPKSLDSILDSRRADGDFAAWISPPFQAQVDKEWAGRYLDSRKA